MFKLGGKSVRDWKLDRVDGNGDQILWRKSSDSSYNQFNAKVTCRSLLQ